MAKIDKNNLAYLGYDYQVRLIAQILTDKRFANSIIDIVDPNYFEDPYLRIIAATIKDAKREDDIIPDVSSLEFRLLSDIQEETQRKYVISQLQKIKEANLNDTLKVQDIAMRFCKQQELKKSIKEIQLIIDKGNLEDYEKCETILRKALEHGDGKDDGIEVMDDIQDALADDFRDPIRTGINGLDEVMNGGLSKGELAVILAPFGVGKSTMVTKIANTAMMDGKNVIQIFFEDMPKIIQRKHLACMSGYELNNLSLHKEELIYKCDELLNKPGHGKLILKKFPSSGTTIPMIRQYIRKKIAEGFMPDIILLDYIDCISSSRHHEDSNIGEGATMREFESMLAELDLAGWTCVQGNRQAISASVVQADQMSGSIKKGMIGHFIVSIAKSLDQKENGTATMAVLKSRFGKDGLIFENIKFDNARVQIDMGNSSVGKTQTSFNKDIEISNNKRVASVFQEAAAKKLKEAINGI